MTEETLKYLREISPASRSVADVAAHLGIDEENTRVEMLRLDLGGFVRAGRGTGGVTVYYAVKPNTWIAWAQ